jgi:hypothetical protein
LLSSYDHFKVLHIEQIHDIKTIAAKEGNSTLLKLKVKIDTTDTAEKKSVTTLVDSGSTGEVIDRDYAKSCCFKLLNVKQKIPRYVICWTVL